MARVMTDETRRKISESLQGRFVGPASPTWKGGSQSASLRRAVIDRDRVCVACGLWDDRPRCMQVHHVDNDETNHEMSNVMLLCVRCHREWHRQEGNGPTMRGMRRKPRAHATPQK